MTIDKDVMKNWIKSFGIQKESEDIEVLKTKILNVKEDIEMSRIFLLEKERVKRSLEDEVIEIETKDLKKKLEKKIENEISLIINHPLFQSINLDTPGEINIKIKQTIAKVFDDRFIYIPASKIKIKKDGNINILPQDELEGSINYWNDKPSCHPHISGHGTPCWGSILTSIMSLLADNELYTLFLLLIDFLESVNPDDVAGEKFYLFDGFCIEDGIEVEIPAQEYTQEQCCSMCEEEYHEDDLYACDNCGALVCDDCSAYMNNYDERVCIDCRDEQYSWCDRCNKYVSDGDYNIDFDMCDDCVDKSTEMCHCCEEGFDKDTVTMVDGERICPECIKEYYTICKSCGRFKHNDDIEKDLNTCIDCRDEQYSWCDRCEEYVKNEDYIDENEMCISCAVKHIISEDNVKEFVEPLNKDEEALNELEEDLKAKALEDEERDRLLMEEMINQQNYTPF